MIACPFCHTALAETAPSCPRCNLDPAKARGVLDPALSVSGLTDLSQTLTLADKKNLIKDFPPQSPPLTLPSFGSSASRGSPAMTANTARTATSSSAATA